MEEEVARDHPVEISFPLPRHVLNQSAEYQVIEKAAQLLKKVEQHWKKSLFQNRLQLSPISESLNSSESENYIEKLAAIKFRDAAFKKPTFCGTDAVNRNAAMNRREQNFLMSYDVVSNYFDIMGTKKSNTNDNRERNDENQPAKCPRCMAKTGQKKSVSVLENQQFVLKQNTYGRRSNLSRQSRGGSTVQISPRSNDSLQSNRTYASAYSSPRIKSNLIGERSRMSTSNPDLRTINKECSQKFQNSRCYCCGNKSDKLKYKTTLNKSEVCINADNSEINSANNVSVINIKSSNQDGPSIPEVNPRKLSIVQDKMIIIQHLPQVDIRPELSKQTGPVICIEAEQQNEEIKESKNNNIGVFNYIHKNKSKVQHYREFKPFTNYSKYRSLTDMNCSEEEFFAAQLELRSVAENFIFRLKKNDNPSGYILMSTLLRLMDEVSELIDTHLNGTGFAPTDSNLPPRMEMVSDLLSDELKTWGSQHPQHYQSLNNIIQHLILDIQFIKNGNIDTLNAKFNEGPSSSHIDKSHKKSSILKTTKRAEFYVEHSGRQRHASTSDSNFDRDRSDLTYRSRNSEEISLSDKLLHENALKVLRLEKAYKINHKARTLKWKEEEKNLKENIPKIEVTPQYSSTSDEGNKDGSAEDSGRQQSLLSSDSTPVVAVISPDESIEEEHHDKTTSVSEDEDKSIAEDIEEVKDSDSIPEEQDEDDRSKLNEDQQSQDNQSEKQHESEGEEEVQEVISDSSQAVDKHKDSGGSDYYEDFEPEVTEQPSQSATATSSHHNENMGKSSQSHHSGNDDLIKNDKGYKSSLFKSSKVDEVDTDKNNFALSLSKPSNQTIPKNINPINIQKVDKISKIKPLEERSSSDSYADFKRYREQKKDAFNKMSSKFNDDKKLNSTDDNNFVKVHVRDKKGEIILSYAGAKVDPDNKAETSSPKKVIKEKCDQETILKPESNIDNYIEAERKVLENLTSNILKGLLDDKIKTILSQFMKDDVKIDEPSTSKFDHYHKQQSTQTSPGKIIKKSPEESENNIIDDESENEYLLKSPTVKLNVESSLRRSDDKMFQSSNLRKEQIISSRKEVERNERKLIKMNEVNSEVDIQQENNGRLSPDLRLLISLVSDLDSSDAEYCEASLNLLKDDEFKGKTQVDNQNLRLHHFNSDEFLVYPHLNPHPSNIKCLQYSQDDGETTKMDQETIGEESIKSEDVVSYNKNISSTPSQIAKMKSVAIECKLNDDKETLDPIIESIHNYNNSSTQTEIKTVSKPYTVQTSSLVDFIELSCSLSSSSSEKLQTVKKESSDSLNKLKIDFPTRYKDESKAHDGSKPKIPELLPEYSTIEKLPVNINTSDVSSDIPNDIDPLNIFTNEKNDEFDTSREYTVIPPLNDDISSITDTTEHSSPSESLESRSTVEGSMLRVLQTSVTRQAAWSSSTDSTTDDERFYFMNQPPSDDDVLNDLEQLMDYLKNSKSSTSNVRIRHCSRHKKM